MTVPATQVDSLGRIKVDQYGRVILANAGDPCCCDDGGGGSDPCQCFYRDVPDCVGGSITNNCEAYEYDADISASGSTSSTIDPTIWQLVTDSQTGLFTGSADPSGIPDAPDLGVLLESEWELNATVTVRCVDGVLSKTTSGTFSYSANYYCYDAGDGGWANRTFSDSYTWTDEPSTNVFNEMADPSRQLPIAGIDFFTYAASFMAISPAIRGFFPPVTATVYGCSDSYPNGSLLFSNDRVPMYAISNQLIGLTFLPDSGYAEVAVIADGENDCNGSTQSATATWSFYGLAPTGDTYPLPEFEQYAAGGATQTYSWSISFTNVAPCE